MGKNIRETILNELSKDKAIQKMMKRITDGQLGMLHFGLGTFIRNKYLFDNKDNIRELEEYYGISHIDDISAMLMRDLYNMLKSKAKSNKAIPKK